MARGQKIRRLVARNDIEPADEPARCDPARNFWALIGQFSTLIDSKRYRAGLRVATTLAESAVNSLVGKRMVKKQQTRWSVRGAHLLMQVRTAEINGELRDRLRAEFRKPEPNIPASFKSKPPLLRVA
jgi:hypothetical protein